ncbi:MAG: O-antigen ligase family protein, partial [Jannaschia sp.]
MFVLAAVPRLSMKIGNIPIYVIDVLIILLMVTAIARRPRRTTSIPFAGTVFLILLFSLAGEVAGSVKSGEMLEPVYVAGRTVLAFSVFYVTCRLVRNARDLEVLMKASILGIIVTATLMILTSLPMTRSAVNNIIFSRTFLEPAADSLAEAVSLSSEGGVRGRTLVGVSILGASFLNVFWPLAALLLRWPVGIGTWRALAWVACFLAPMGVLMSYSRGPILGTVLLLLATILLGLSRVRRGIVFPVVLGIGIVAVIGTGSQLFYFDRLTVRTEAIFEDPLADERESERLLAYVEPFGHLIEHPRFFVLGEGNAIQRSAALAEQTGKATHAIFAKSYYAYGMVGALLLVALYC